MLYSLLSALFKLCLFQITVLNLFSRTKVFSAGLISAVVDKGGLSALTEIHKVVKRK